MKAAACSAARAALWLLAFWTFVWSCFLLMQYVSAHPAVPLMHDSVELTSAQQVVGHANAFIWSSQVAFTALQHNTELHFSTRFGVPLHCMIRIGSSRPSVWTPASCMTAHKQVQQALRRHRSRSLRSLGPDPSSTHYMHVTSTRIPWIGRPTGPLRAAAAHTLHAMC